MAASAASASTLLSSPLGVSSLPLVRAQSFRASSLSRHISPSTSFAASASRRHGFQQTGVSDKAVVPLCLQSGTRRGYKKIVGMATGESAEASDILNQTFKNLQDAWDKTDDKIAIGGLGFTSLIVLWSSTGLISAIDKLPLIPTIFEFIGILFSGWFIYRYLLYKPDREELLKIIEDTASRITGTES